MMICSCGSDKNAKIRDNGSSLCLPCWNIIKQNKGNTLICEDCNSNKASHRFFDFGVSVVLCDSCYINEIYEDAK